MQGKWIIQIPKDHTLPDGASRIDTIWEKVVQGVRDAAFDEAKTSTPSNKFENQVIIIYTYDHNKEADVERCLNEMRQREIISNDEIIDYKTEHQTRAGIDEAKFTSAKFPPRKTWFKWLSTPFTIVARTIGAFASYLWNSLFGK